jgi:threonine dehydrogenase-like Zn-dependent dehydrogenase
MSDFFSSSYTFLSNQKANGIKKDVALGRDAAFDKAIELAGAQSITVFEKNKRKGFISMMGFPKQTNTTEVGFFFEGTQKGTTVTISSLSSTALKKAEDLILNKI